MKLETSFLRRQPKFNFCSSLIKSTKISMSIIYHYHLSISMLGIIRIHVKTRDLLLSSTYTLIEAIRNYMEELGMEE